ncbi:MAG: cytochrome c3 family protein [Thermodesulfobacteriota bacterium]
MKTPVLRRHGAALFTALSILPSLIFAVTASAKVSGPCANCHTMHNSQDGGALVHSGAGVGWNADGVLDGGTTSTTPVGSLLVADCIGCHSSTTDQTIIDLGGGSRVPIVFNTTADYPVNALAGGNFQKVAQGPEFHGYGHNVYGIAAHDIKLSAAPGNTRCSGVASSCHNTLAAAPSGQNYDRGGCRGCHYNVYHHTDNGQYRFLNSHDEPQGAYVTGIEHGDWEHPTTTGPTNHNMYKGYDKTIGAGQGQGGDGIVLKTSHSISSYCAGCHNAFHNNDGTGTAVWLRHPTDIALPTTGEYAQYNPVTNYEVQSPVAWIDPANPKRDEAIVMCLSCHRVHGSEHADILRWDYSKMVAADAGDAAGDGCFVCHTTKDD